MQHMHPPGTSLRKISFSLLVPVSSKLASTPTSPNSLTKTAHRSFSGFWLNKFRIAVVLPTPKKPEMILVGTSAMVSVDLVIDSKSKLPHLCFKGEISGMLPQFQDPQCFSIPAKIFFQASLPLQERQRPWISMVDFLGTNPAVLATERICDSRLSSIISET